MRKFETSIIDTLNTECNGENVYYVGLGAHDFQVSFGNVDRILSEEKAVFVLRGKRHVWTESPSSIPIGLLIEQTPIHFELPNPLALRMCFKSGDFVEFYTSESMYEAVRIDLGVRSDVRIVYVF